MDKEKTCLVIHPKAARYVDGVVPVLEERWDVTPLVTEYAGHGMVLAQQAAEQGYQWVIALGGDGTLNEVVNGMAKAQGPCTVGVLPGGMTNQWVREIGLPAHPIAAARALLSCTPRRADLGYVAVQEVGFPQQTLQQEAVSRPTTRDHFLLTAGLGLDAAVIQMTAEAFRQRYGQLAFYLTWLETFPRIHRIPVQIEWSSGATWEGQPREVLVNNARHYGNVVDVAPEAYVNDGLLDIRLFWYSEVLFHYVQDCSFSLRVPVPVAMHLDGSLVSLADYLSPQTWARLQQVTDPEKVTVTYRFTVKPGAVSVAVPQGYAGEVFNGTCEHQAPQSEASPRTSLVVSAAEAPAAGSKAKAFRAIRLSYDPLASLAHEPGAVPFLRTADVILRENHDLAEIYSDLIRLATGGIWSHAALLCWLGKTSGGWNEAFLIEARPGHPQLVKWRDEVVPLDQFCVAIKRLRLDWYVETPEEACRHDPADPADEPGIDYLRHVCGMAVGQINSLYDTKTVYELAALYLEQLAKRYLGADLQAMTAGGQQPGALPHVVPATTLMDDWFKLGAAIDLARQLEQVAKAELSVIPTVAERVAGLPHLLRAWEAVPAVADFFTKWKKVNYSTSSVMRFMCSGLVQYSFFEALRRRIMHDLTIAAHRDVAMSNLGNLPRVLFRDDPEELLPAYVQQVQSGKRAISDPVPERVLHLLKTAVPMDFSTSPNLQWHYVIRRGVVWRIEVAPADYAPQSQEEQEVVAMLASERFSLP